MQDTYVDLRRCICTDADELAHFRELLILMVMSTDGKSARVASYDVFYFISSAVVAHSSLLLLAQ